MSNSSETNVIPTTQQAEKLISAIMENGPAAGDLKNPSPASEQQQQQPMSKSAQKKVLKQTKYEAKKAEKKAAEKAGKKREVDRKRREWEAKLGAMSEEEKLKVIEAKNEVRKRIMEQRKEEKGNKIEKLNVAKHKGHNIVIDLDFSDLMAPNEIHSLVQQIMYCYSKNSRCASPAHLWLTGFQGEMGSQLEKIPGFDRWIIEKEQCSYIEAFESKKENLVYLTADSETMLYELDLSKIYIVGGLVDRNRWKGITMNKAKDQGIQTAKLPIGEYLKMSSSQVLTVNHVIEILLKFLETQDWKTSFFEVIPPRKRCESDTDGCLVETKGEENEEKFDQEPKKLGTET